jgi:hypothetical protein
MHADVNTKLTGACLPNDLLRTLGAFPDLTGGGLGQYLRAIAEQAQPSQGYNAIKMQEREERNGGNNKSSCGERNRSR